MSRPRRILVTRPAAQAATLCNRLRQIGIDPVAVPVIAVAPPVSFDALDDALLHLDRYDWILFTSANGVRAFFDRRHAIGDASPLPALLQWAAIGPATADAIAAQGIARVWMPSRYLSETVARELPSVQGERVLRVRAAAASDIPARGLRARGITVDEVVAYQTVEAPADAAAPLAQAFALGLDGVIFTSASTVRAFGRLVDAAGLRSESDSLTFVAIGPVTETALVAAGWPVHLVAEEHSVDGLIRLLQERSDSGAADIARR